MKLEIVRCFFKGVGALLQGVATLRCVRSSKAVSISVHRGWASWPHPASVLSTCFTDMVGEFSFSLSQVLLGNLMKLLGTTYVIGKI